MKIRELAAASHGVVTRRRLLQNGVTRQQIATRLRRGDLVGEHPGVYRVGPRIPSTEAKYLAAVLAAGDGAALCGQAAAHLWGLLKGPAPSAEVVAPGQRRIDGVRTHRSRRLGRTNVTVFRGIPVTTQARTVVDIAGDLSEDALARVCHEAGVRYGLTPGTVSAVLELLPTARGAAKLRRVVTGEVHVTLSKLEAGFLRLLRSNELPLPETNRRTGGYRVDCRWPEHRLTVELDSYRFHNSRHTWEQDRRREREARARGDDFRRYTYGDLEKPKLMLRELSAVLAPREA